MEEQIDFSNIWEAGLVKVARGQLGLLRELNADCTGDIGAFDINAALSGLCALTDLIYETGFNFSENARAALSQINERAMEVMRVRARLQQTPPGGPGKLEIEAAVTLYDAILSNLPSLAAGETSGHALALSKAMYNNLVEKCGSRPRFEAVSSVICIHDYKAMQLAGRPGMGR